MPHSSRLLTVAAFLSGCGFAQLQTARTVPAGLTQTTFGGGFVSSAFQNGRAPPPTDGLRFVPLPAYFPPHLEVRHGLTNDIDVGGRLTFGVGASGDVKWNVLPARWPLALAVAAGAGAAVQPGDRGIYVLQVPVTVSASYDVASWLTPYVGVSYRGIWIWGQDDPTRPDYNYTAPTGRGEAVLVPVAGLAIGGDWALLVEYGRLRPLWHDPGHGYTFVPAEMFSIAIRSGRHPAFDR